MVTRESFTDDPEQVELLIRWWLSNSNWRWHLVLRTRSVRDFVNDVWVRLLSNFPPGKTVKLKLSTVVVNHCIWELAGRRRGENSIRSERDFQAMMREAEAVRPEHKTEDGEQYLVEHVQLLQLNETIAWAMRTLTWREAVIVRARLGLFGDKEMSLEQVAVALKVTRERIRQIEKKAISKLQHYSRARKLIPFLDLQTEK